MSEYKTEELTNNKKIVWAIAIAASFLLGLTLSVLAFGLATQPSPEPTTISTQSGCAGIPECADTTISIDEETSFSSSGCAGVGCEETVISTQTGSAGIEEEAAKPDIFQKIQAAVAQQQALTEKLAAEHPPTNPKTVVDNTTYFVGEYK